MIRHHDQKQLIEERLFCLCSREVRLSWKEGMAANGSMIAGAENREIAAHREQ